VAAADRDIPPEPLEHVRSGEAARAAQVEHPINRVVDESPARDVFP
jgi:hypothetical protein